MFSLLTKKDLEKAIQTEFDTYCSEKGYNSNVFETRYAIADHQLDKDKIKVILISESKIGINRRIQQMEKYKLTNIIPVPMSIPNLIEPEKDENYVIVNIEEKTTITTVIDNQIIKADLLEEGSSDFLSKINLKENSYAKAYEICKNTTIYTSEGKELQDVDVSYLEDIMPTLYEIAIKTQKIVEESTEKISKVYLTGTGSLINNIDLYFQEYISETDCQILKPYFIENTRDVNIKDYIEVNSAISLAIMGLGEGIEGINFKKTSLIENLPDWMTKEIGGTKEKKGNINKKGILNWDLGKKLDKIEVNLVRGIGFILMIILIYNIFSILIVKQINKKDEEVNKSISNTNQQIALVNKDNEKIKTKTNEYTNLIRSIQDAKERLALRNRTRNAIPNLLNQIMSIIPENVQLTSIENINDTHIIINAKSNKYEQLGYLKAKIKTDVILTNVTSTAGQKEQEVVLVKIEGDLP